MLRNVFFLMKHTLAPAAGGKGVCSEALHRTPVANHLTKLFECTVEQWNEKNNEVQYSFTRIRKQQSFVLHSSSHVPLQVVCATRIRTNTFCFEKKQTEFEKQYKNKATS